MRNSRWEIPGRFERLTLGQVEAARDRALGFDELASCLGRSGMARLVVCGSIASMHRDGSGRSCWWAGVSRCLVESVTETEGLGGTSGFSVGLLVRKNALGLNTLTANYDPDSPPENMITSLVTPDRRLFPFAAYNPAAPGNLVNFRQDFIVPAEYNFDEGPTVLAAQAELPVESEPRVGVQAPILVAV